MVHRRASAGEIRKAAIEQGMLTLRQDGLRKAAAGITTLPEVRAVTQAVREGV
ncbi:MAG: hypothetical protein M5U26_22950 [Planctomycetota bacterium]|nr:hypothetical protein [Planctomycetota bacterium]